MTRYVSRIMMRRGFDGCSDGHDYCNEEVPPEKMTAARVRYYEEELMKAMLKILYLERLSENLGAVKNVIRYDNYYF